MLHHARILRSFPLTACLLLISAAYGCSTGEGANGANGSDSNAGTIFGDWSGSFTNKSAEVGSALRDASATVTFEKTDDTSGNFSIELTAMKDAYVKGAYASSDRSLLLDIKDSTISTIGLKGSATKIDYDLTGPILSLHNDRIELTVTRKSSGDATSSSGKDSDKPSDPLVGRWNCDSAGTQWQLNLRDNGTFAIDVYDPGTNRGSVWLEGSLAVTRGQANAPDAVLTVTDSDVTKYKGMVMQATARSDNLLQLTRTGETMQCSRG